MSEISSSSVGQKESGLVKPLSDTELMLKELFGETALVTPTETELYQKCVETALQATLDGEGHVTLDSIVPYQWYSYPTTDKIRKFAWVDIRVDQLINKFGHGVVPVYRDSQEVRQITIELSKLVKITETYDLNEYYQKRLQEEVAKVFPKEGHTEINMGEEVPVTQEIVDMYKTAKKLWDNLATTTGTKYDSDKPRHTLIDPHFEQCLIDILEYGAKKYGVDNWQGLNNLEERYINAIYRHLSEIRKGNLEDSESGLPHLGHIAASVMFLYWFNHVKVDDNKT